LTRKRLGGRRAYRDVANCFEAEKLAFRIIEPNKPLQRTGGPQRWFKV
jgi:hypothetical protein